MSIKGIRLPKVLEIVGASRSWLYQEIAANRFPKPVHLGKRSVIWIEQEIFDYLDGLIKQSRPSSQSNGVK